MSILKTIQFNTRLKSVAWHGNSQESNYWVTIHENVSEIEYALFIVYVNAHMPKLTVANLKAAMAKVVVMYTGLVGRGLDIVEA